MTADDRAAIRGLYNAACHGAGAEARWEARDRMERIMDEAGLDMARVFDAMGLDLGAWFASRPIGRRGSECKSR